MVWYRPAALVFFFCCGSAAVSGLAQQRPPPEEPQTLERPCSLAGRVLYARGLQPAEGVEVKLIKSGIAIEQTYTHSSGRFEFRLVAQDLYEIEASAEGYQTARLSLDLTMFCRNENVTIVLNPRRGAGEEGTDPVVSTTELKIPRKAEKAFEKGLRELHDNHRPERSERHFRRALELYADYDQAYVQLGLAYLQQDKFKEAQEVLEKATSINAENARAYLVLGMVHGRQGELNDSLLALMQAVRLDDNDWLAHFELGKALARGEIFKDAHTHAQRAHQLNPESPPAHLFLYEMCLKQRDYQTALAKLDEFLEHFPDNTLTPQVRQERERLQQALAAASQ